MKEAISYVSNEIAELSEKKTSKIIERDKLLAQYNEEISVLENQIKESNEVLELHKQTSTAMDKVDINAGVLDVFKKSNPEYVVQSEAGVYQSRLRESSYTLDEQVVKYSAYPSNTHKIDVALNVIQSTQNKARPFLSDAEMLNKGSLEVADEFVETDEIGISNLNEDAEDIQFLESNDMLKEFATEVNSEVESYDFSAPVEDDNNYVDELLAEYNFEDNDSEKVESTDELGFNPFDLEEKEETDFVEESDKVNDFVNFDSIEDNNSTRLKVVDIEELNEHTLRRVA